MTSIAEPMPRAVRVLRRLLGLTALTTVTVELLNWSVSQEAGWALFARTAWAVIRCVAFLVLIWQVRLGRASAAPFALVLCVTTLFALARLVIPRHGLPDWRGVAGFGIVALLCAVVLLMMYRNVEVNDYLVRRQRSQASRRPPPPPGWVLTARVAVLSYSPLMLVAPMVALDQVFAGRLAIIAPIIIWFLISVAVTYASLLVGFAVRRASASGGPLLIALTIVVLGVHLPLCYLLLGMDGLIRDGGPVLFAAMLALLAFNRASAQTA